MKQASTVVHEDVITQSGRKASNLALTNSLRKTCHYDPLKLIQDEAPSQVSRVVLRTVSLLILLLVLWSIVGELDIVASAEGKLVPQTLVKVVQPVESGVVKEILVSEGDKVLAGQVLARLDTTLTAADQSGVANDIALQRMQERRIKAELTGVPMVKRQEDDPNLFAIIESQYRSHIEVYRNNVDQEKMVLEKQVHEAKAVEDVLNKLEQTLPVYIKVATAYEKLEKEGFMGSLASTDKQREAIEKAHDLDSQKANMAAMLAGIAAQKKRISQLESTYTNDLQRELTDIQSRITQLQPNLAKTNYRAGLTELRAPQSGIIKDLATTTIGAVVQPGAVVMTLIPKDEALYADVNVRNDDVGFTHVGQTAQVKLSAYPFQQYGMLSGRVIRLSLDAADNGSIRSSLQANGNLQANDNTSQTETMYRARIQLNAQQLQGPDGIPLSLTAGMKISAEIHQGHRTILQYLISPVRKVISEAARER